MRSRGVNDQLRGPPRAKFPEAGHQSRELVIRNSQENQFAAANDLFYGQDRYSRQERVGTFSRLFRGSADSHEFVSHCA